MIIYRKLNPKIKVKKIEEGLKCQAIQTNQEMYLERN